MKKRLPYILVLCLLLLVYTCGDDKDDTTKPDDTPLSPVVSTFPPSNATDVERDVVISATFREDMDSLSINNNTFTLSYNPPVSGTVDYVKSTRTATFTPDSLLDYGTTYTASITTGVKNSSGTPLASAYSWSFGIKIIPGEGPVFLPRTGQTLSYAQGDDGDTELGVAWPTPRFVDHGDGTVTDELTGLMWLKDGSCLGREVWRYRTYWMIDSLNIDPSSLGCQEYTNSYTDWRLPNVNELESLVHAERSDCSAWLNSIAFTGVEQNYYWSSTTNSLNLGEAYTVHMWVAYVEPRSKNVLGSVWAVRGVTSQPALIWKTGQVTSYRPGDDGDLQIGASWPNPRFYLHTNNATTTDLLTGLMWLRSADPPTIGTCTGGVKTWSDALDYIECLNSYDYAGHSDWRLPNRKELFSLIDRSQINPPLPPDNYFADVQLGNYWTSTTYRYDTSRAWMISMRHGWMDPIDKTSNAYVWPVRGGR
jgi:hypothetical protein